MTIFQPKLVMIDVDGTLVDSVPDLAYCVDQMMLSLDMPVRGEETVRHWVGNGVPRLVERALTGELDGSPSKEAFDKAYPIFLDLYAQNSSVRSTLYEGVMEGLDYLKSKDYLLGCVTNKAEQFTLPLLQSLGIIDYFGIVISGDTLEKKKPDPLPLIHGVAFLILSPMSASCLEIR
jgi:phosphoglycolate phosphatase